MLLPAYPWLVWVILRASVCSFLRSGCEPPTLRDGRRAGGGVATRSPRAESWGRIRSQTLLMDVRKQTAS